MLTYQGCCAWTIAWDLYAGLEFNILEAIQGRNVEKKS